MINSDFKSEIFKDGDSMKYIRRHIEDLVKETHQSFKSVLVTGARQTGKSTLLNSLFPDMRHVTLDDEFVKEQAQENPATFIMLNQPPVFYDEVQHAPQLFPQIKIWCDQSEQKGLFCLSGSQPLNLMKNVSESLTGRVGILELAGLSLREIQNDPFSKPFLPVMDYVTERQKTVTSPDNIWEIIHRGSYPELQDPSVNWSIYYSSYVTTYLERDVRQLSAVQNLSDFRKFMIAVAARTGQLLNNSNIADEIGKDEKTVRNWMSILEASGIIYILEPYSNSALKRAMKTPKVYFRDTGLAAYLTRWLTPETLANGAMSGAFFETFVVNEILKSYMNRGIDYRFCVSYYRGRDKGKEQEIDLLIEENGVLYPIEIKQNDRVKAEQTSAFQVLDAVIGRKRGMGAVICMCSQPGFLRDNVMALPVWYI